MAAREDLERGESLLGHVHALDGLELGEEDVNAGGDDASGAGQRLHHVGEGAAGVVHQLEVVVGCVGAHAGEEERDGLLDGKADERVLVAHDEQLAEFGERGQLERVVGLVEGGDEALGAAADARGHGAVQELLHLGIENVEDLESFISDCFAYDIWELHNL